MTTNYAKRALEILRKEGPAKLFKKVTRFSFKQLLRPLGPQRRFKFHTWKNNLQNHIRYDAPPDPYNTIDIKPSEIKSQAGRKSLAKVKKGNAGIARTVGGEWDRSSNRWNVEEDNKIKGVIQRFEYKKKWDETEIHNYYMNKGCDLTQVEEWYSNIESLFENIKENGYVAGHKGSHHREYSQPIRDRLEVLVTIDRDGEVCLFEGKHRFAIARVLEIKIPAHVVCRHKQWQELRDEIHNNGLPEGREDLRNHPDLQDILD